jgi:hypothetical protein
MDMRRMRLPPRTFLIDEAPDLDIPKARVDLIFMNLPTFPLCTVRLRNAVRNS